MTVNHIIAHCSVSFKFKIQPTFPHSLSPPSIFSFAESPTTILLGSKKEKKVNTRVQ